MAGAMDVPALIIDARNEEQEEEEEEQDQAAAPPSTTVTATPATKKPAGKKPKKAAAKRRASNDDQGADPSTGGGGGGKRPKKKEQSFKCYINKVLKQVHPDTAISSKAMKIMDNFVSDVFDKLAYEVSGLVKRTSKRTVGANDVQTAVKLLIPGELCKHALSEGIKAVTKFTNQQ